MVVQDIKPTKEKHAPALRANLMAMRISWFSAERITQYSRARATLDATECRNQASIRPALSWWTPWSSILAKLLFKASIQKAQNGPSTQLIKATSFVERLNATIKAGENS